MKQFIVTIPDSKTALFIEIMKNLSFVKRIRESTDPEIPEEHKAIVRERVEKYKSNPEEYGNWNDIENKIKPD